MSAHEYQSTPPAPAAAPPTSMTSEPLDSILAASRDGAPSPPAASGDGHTALRRTDLTLMEQLRISESDVARRKELLDLTPADEALLASCQAFMAEEVGGVVDEFYAIQTSNEEIAALIGDADTLRRLHVAQTHYILDLFHGHYDMAYVNNRLRLGIVHKRIGLESRMYLCAVRTLTSLLRERIARHVTDPPRRQAVSAALEKMMYFDTSLVFDTYIGELVSEVEAGRRKVEAYASSLEEQVAERTRQLEELSRRDDLTGLYSHRTLGEFLQRDVLQARRRAQALSLLYLDVDNFKEINDRDGHQAGDDVLKAVADVLRAVCREVDVPCRYGGDEFCLILPDCDAPDAQKVGERLIAALREARPDVSVSIGVARMDPEEMIDPDELVRRADRKMYEAKRAVGSQVRH